MKKVLNNENYITILDKLTRFEPANIRYKKLFEYLLSKFYFKTDIRSISDSNKINLAVEIFNKIAPYDEFDDKLNCFFMELEDRYFGYNEESYQYLSKRLNIYNIATKIKNLDINKKNLTWLLKICKQKNNIFEADNINSSFLPVNKILLCEGQTENILLETLFKIFGKDFDYNGIYLLPAGGKNRVAKKYYKMSETYKIPFFILLDSDAVETKELIEPKLRKCDKLYLIKSGEFEDLIPTDIIIKAINSFHRNDYNCTENDFTKEKSTVKNLEIIYKKYGFGEFKKAEFAEILNDYIISNCKKDDFLNSEIVNIINEF